MQCFTGRFSIASLFSRTTAAPNAATCVGVVKGRGERDQRKHETTYCDAAGGGAFSVTLTS